MPTYNHLPAIVLRESLSPKREWLLTINDWPVPAVRSATITTRFDCPPEVSITILAGDIVAYVDGARITISPEIIAWAAGNPWTRLMRLLFSPLHRLYRTFTKGGRP